MTDLRERLRWPNRVVNTSIPGLVLLWTGKHSYTVDFTAVPDENGWAVARNLPRLAREAIAAHKARLVRLRRLHTVYRRGWKS